MKKNKPIILTDPFPRTLNLIFTNYNLQFLQSNFKLIAAPKSQENKKKFLLKKIIKLNLKEFCWLLMSKIEYTY